MVHNRCRNPRKPLAIQARFFRIRLDFATSDCPLKLIIEEIHLLTESTVERMFRELMNSPERNDELFDKAEELLEEELRPESPLRHRLSVELDELRSVAAKG